MIKTRLLGLLAGSLLLLPAFGAEYTAGVHFDEIETPQPVQTGDKIEVVELFWYGCPHCYNLEPYIQKWLRNKPENAEYVPTPAVLRDSWAFHAGVYYTFEALGLVERLHGAFYDAIHKERRNIRSVEAFADWASEQGVDRKQIVDTFGSFGVDSKVRTARMLSERYGATGVPTIIVDGRYRATSTMAGGHEALMGMVDFLVAKAAEERP